MIALFANTMFLALGQNFQRGELSDWFWGKGGEIHDG